VDERVRSSVETQATLPAPTDVQAHAIADADRSLGQPDSAVAAKRGRTATAPSVVDEQRKSHHVGRDASTLLYLNAERATFSAKERQVEAEAAAVRDVAEPVGAETDSERTIRWLLALIMLCCESSAGALTAAAPARNRPQGDAALPEAVDDVAPLRRRASTAQMQSELSPSPDERRVPRHKGAPLITRGGAAIRG